MLDMPFANMRRILQSSSVICCYYLVRISHCLAEETPTQQRLIDRLDPQTRGKVVLALAGLVMLGLLMMGLTWLTFRSLRRQFRNTDEIIQRQQVKPDDDDWARRPLAEKQTKSH